MDNYSQNITLKSFFLDLFFPRFCLGCNREGSYLCFDCRSLLDISEFNYCLCSKNPLRLPQGPGKCNSCNHKKLSGLISALPYQERPLTRKLIHQFKYEPHLKDLAPTLASLIIEHLLLTKQNTELFWENAILIPVPLDKQKLKKRDYNQTELLAKELSKIIQIPVTTNVLVKNTVTPSQMKLSKKEREENLKGAFTLKDKTALANKKVFLVDDVYTTGSTMEECANVLRTSGVKEVIGLVLAREA